MAQPLRRSLDTLLGVRTEPLLIHNAEHGREDRRRIGNHAYGWGWRRRGRRHRGRPRGRRAARLGSWRDCPRRAHRRRRSLLERRFVRRIGGEDRGRDDSGRQLRFLRRRRGKPALDRGTSGQAEACREEKNGGSHRALLNGNLTVMVVPCPSSLRTSMVPSCICTIR